MSSYRTANAAPTRAARLAAPAQPARLATPARAARLATPARAARLATPARAARLATPARAARLATPARAARLATPARPARLATPARPAHLATPARPAHLAAPARAARPAAPAHRAAPARLARAVLLALVACLFAPLPALAASPRVAALQVALRHHGVYSGTVDGLSGPGTAAAVRRFQARRGLTADGVVGPRTRRAFGALGRHPIGSRPLRAGHTGWDVAALQFALGAKGFAGGPVDGGFGPRTTAAVQRLQRYAGLRADGVAGPATMAVVRRPPPATPPVRRPIDAPIGDRYGPRGNTFHAGLDFPAPFGTTVRAAAPGRVTFAGFASGWGLVVTVDHGGWKTRYAHLSRATVSPGASVAAGERVGLVGATGVATGPHLHFEVVVRGANVNPANGL